MACLMYGAAVETRTSVHKKNQEEFLRILRKFSGSKSPHLATIPSLVCGDDRRPCPPWETKFSALRMSRRRDTWRLLQRTSQNNPSTSVGKSPIPRPDRARCPIGVPSALRGIIDRNRGRILLRFFVFRGPAAPRLRSLYEFALGLCEVNRKRENPLKMREFLRERQSLVVTSQGGGGASPATRPGALCGPLVSSDGPWRPPLSPA